MYVYCCIYLFYDDLMCPLRCPSHPWSNYCNIWSEIQIMYCCITSTKSPSFCMKSFSACLTNLTILLPQSWLQLLRKQTNTGTSAALTAETDWFMCTLSTQSLHHFAWQPPMWVTKLVCRPQWRECSCYISRRMPAPWPPWL